MTDLDHGTVAAWKGSFGFIHRDGDNHDLFCHQRDLDGLTDLLPGRRVVFQTVPARTANRLKAIRCRYEQ